MSSTVLKIGTKTKNTRWIVIDSFSYLIVI